MADGGLVSRGQLMPGEGRITFLGGESFTIRQPCNAPAPLVLNGAAFVGCPLDKDHDGDHEVKIIWSSK